MANKTINMLQVRRIIQLKKHGNSNRQIARELRISRDSVNEYTKRIEQTGIDSEQLLRLPDEDLCVLLYPSTPPIRRDWRYNDFQQRVKSLVEELAKPRTNRQVLWEEYLKQVPGGYSYSQFCEHLGRYLETTRAVMHFEHQPGAEMMIDFAGDNMSYIDPRTGEIIGCPVLVCILPFSGYTYMEALLSAQREQLLKGLNNCLIFLGGVSFSIKSDNLAQMVKKSNRYEPAFNELAEQWSMHYDTTLTATRVRSPRDKASVESMVNTVYNRVYAMLRNKVFHSIDQLNEAVREQIEIFNQRLFQGRDYSRYDKFLQHEKSLLRPLPATVFVPKYKVSSKVQRNYHITLGEDRHHYSVPYQYIGRQVEVVYDTDTVEVYYEHQRIACHKRDYRRYQYTTLAEHMPPNHKYYNQIKGYDRDYFLERSRIIGEKTVSAIERVLDQKVFIEQTYNSCLGVLRLADKYGNERLDAACARALLGSKVTYTMIRNILERNLDKSCQQPELLPHIPPHENIRGQEAYG
jgi:transposase